MTKTPRKPTNSEIIAAGKPGLKTLKQRLIERTLRSMTPAERRAAKADTRTLPERYADLKGYPRDGGDE